MYICKNFVKMWQMYVYSSWENSTNTSQEKYACSNLIKMWSIVEYGSLEYWTVNIIPP